MIRNKGMEEESNMKKADLLIRSVHAYCPEDLGIVDIAVKDGLILEIGSNLEYEAGQTIDGTGKIMLPGVIETHAHMSMPFAGTKTMNTFRDGTCAGAFGGVTTLVDFAQQIGGTSLHQSLRDRLEEARGRCFTDYAFHITLTNTLPETIDEIGTLCKEGYTSFKVHTTYKSGGLYIDTKGLYDAFRAVAGAGGLMTVHAENDDMMEAAVKRLIAEGKTQPCFFPESKPDAAEAEAVERCIRIAKETGCKLLIRHISSQAAATAILQAQKDGYPIFAETCPQYLAFTREVYAGEDARDYILHPPIRGKKDREAIWSAIEAGMTTVLATDDCGFYRKQKRMADTFYGVPGGLPGIETRLLTVYGLGIDTGRIDLTCLARMTSETPAKLYGLYPQKGTLRAGSDADMVILDPNRPTEIKASDLHEQSDYTPFEGLRASAALDKTIARGKVMVDGRQFCADAGAGRLLHRGLPQL